MRLVPSRLILFLLLLSLRGFAQPSERKLMPADYISRYKDDAVREMQLSRVPASITLAQGMLESDNGNSALAVYANNHFGIKCHTEWTGETYIQDDDEKNECFRKYKSVYDSYQDHSNFLSTRKRYAALFELKTTDYKGWARGLKEAGYATDPKYADRLIDIIERNKLYEFDVQQPLPSVIVKSQPKPQTVSATASGREILRNNDVKCVVVKKGDTFYKLAQELGLEVWQLYKYNELDKNAVLKPGQMIYLQPKRKKSRSEISHTVKPDETLHQIAQQYGVKLSALYKLNNLKPGATVKTGDVILLRRKR
jgi:LysM repeat protein